MSVSVIDAENLKKGHVSVGKHLNSSTIEFQPRQAENQVNQEPNSNVSMTKNIAWGVLVRRN